MSTRPCGRDVYWWDGEYEGNCELPADHQSTDLHFDGLSWFNDDNEPAEPLPVADEPVRFPWEEPLPACMKRTGCHDYKHGTDCPLYDWARSIDAGRPL